MPLNDSDTLAGSSSPLVQNKIASVGLPAPYGSATDVRTEDVTQLHDLEPVDDAESGTDYLAEYLQARPYSETPRFEPRKQIFSAIVVVSMDASIDIPFKAQSLRFDNLTSQWIFIPQLRRWIPPFWYGAVLNVTGLSSVAVMFQAPPGLVQPVAIANGVVQLIAHSDYVPEVDGESVIAITQSGALANQVQGVTASNTPLSGNPILIGGSDGVNVQNLRVNGSNYLIVAPASQVAVGDAQSVNAAQLQTASNTSNSLAVNPMVYNGAAWDRNRTANVFKTAIATAAGNTALWTPTAGKKFRLMRYMIQATQDIASAGGVSIDVTFQDSATAIGIGFTFFAPNVSVVTAGGGDNSGWCDIGNGYLSTTINNVLNINLSAALSSGKVRVVCCGTEE